MDELQRILEEIPDEALIGVLADRIQRAPNKEVKKVVQIMAKQSFSGPIPPPSMLREYNTVDEDFSNRIITMAESQQSHRIELEKKSVEAAINAESRG